MDNLFRGPPGLEAKLATVTEEMAKGILAECLYSAIQANGEFGAPGTTSMEHSTFFDGWFRHFSNAFCFIFRRSFEATNIHTAELLALIEAYTSSNSGAGQQRSLNRLHFHSSRDFLRALRAVTEQLKPDQIPPGRLRQVVDRVVEHQWPLFCRSVVADFRFRSCQIFLPPHLSLDLARVCGEAGFTYSCGRLVYVRRVEKTRIAELRDYLQRHLEFHGTSQHELVFHGKTSHSTGSHPTVESLGRPDLLDDDLASLTVHLDKSEFDGRSMLQLPLLIKSEDESEGTDPASISGATQDARRLWVFSDRGIQYHSDPATTDDRYLVVYDEEFVNHNPLFIFDENKPGWIAPVTIPHTLYAAMINITKPWTGSNIVLGDPFCGAATALLESLNHQRVSVKAGDAEALLEVVHELNRHFFSCDDSEFDTYYKLLARLANGNAVSKDVPAWMAARIKEANDASAVRNSRHSSTIASAEHLLEVFLAAERAGDPRARASALSSVRETFRLATHSARMAFFVFLRAQRRLGDSAGADLRRETRSYFAEELRKQAFIFGRWRELARKGESAPEASTLRTAAVERYRAVFMSPEKFKELGTLKRPDQMLVGDDGDLRRLITLSPGSLNLVITDPPYGLNARAETLELADLYAVAIPAFIDALRPNGHLVICLPSKSYVGKSLPYCTSASLITSQVLSAAAEKGRSAYTPARGLPSPHGLYSAPYYWRSDRALKREVLHFRIS